MSSHFLLSAKARTLSLSAVLRMTDQEAEQAFGRIRWPGTNGKPVCWRCGCQTVYDCRKANGAPRWRCKACRKDFSVTSGTIFAFHKMPLRNYLAAIAIFVNEVKGKSALAPQPRSGLPVQDGVRPGPQAARGDGFRAKGAAPGRARRDGRSRRRLFRRLHQAREPSREPDRSPLGQAPDRQAAGCRCDARAGRFHPSGRVQVRDLLRWAGSPLAYPPIPA